MPAMFGVGRETLSEGEGRASAFSKDWSLAVSVSVTFCGITITLISYNLYSYLIFIFILSYPNNIT